MHSKYLANFLLDLGPPLGSDEGDNIWDSAKNSSNFKLKRDESGFIYFKELLYEIIKYHYKDKIFKDCSLKGFLEIKSLDKDIRYRLHYAKVRFSFVYFLVSQ